MVAFSAKSSFARGDALNGDANIEGSRGKGVRAASAASPGDCRPPSGDLSSHMEAFMPLMMCDVETVLPLCGETRITEAMPAEEL